MMRERATELKVGILIAAALVILVAFIFVLGNFSLRSGYTLYVDYRFSGNIREGAPVKVSGIKVGKVALLLKYADYDATGFSVDTRKLWLQAEWAL